jgi:hypothetical protein
MWRDELREVEGQNALLAELAVLQLEAAAAQADQQAEAAGGDDPAPPDAPAVAEVDERVADEADQQTGDGAEHSRHKGEQAVLDR